MFPFIPQREQSMDNSRILAGFLPPYEHAISLIDKYFESAVRIYLPVSSTQVNEHLIPRFYPLQFPLLPLALQEQDVLDLALLFSIFVAGSIFAAPQCRPEQECRRFLHLARAALAFGRVIENGSFSAVQAIFILGTLEYVVGCSGHQERAYNYLGFAFQLAISVMSFNCTLFSCMAI